MSSRSILVIDDEPQIRKLLEITLRSHDYKVMEAEKGRVGLLMAANHPPDLILLDIGLPDESGHDVLAKLREWYSKPIIILSVQDREEDIVRALDNGANDYLVKPFRTGELLARIRSAFRSSIDASDKSEWIQGDLHIDYVARTVKKNGTLIKLTATEYALLALLAKYEGRILTHQYLLKEIWGPGRVDELQYLRVFIAQVRRKIETDPNHPQYIITQSGVGYRFGS